MFRVNVIPAADDGSGWYRMRLPAQVLRAKGIDVEVCSAYSIPRACEVTVIQRPMREAVHKTVIPDFHRIGTAVVIDLDDDFASVSPNNAAWRTMQSASINARNAQAACALADMVTVTTPALADRYGKHGRVEVLPNYVPEDYFSIAPEPHSGTWLGWTGTVRSHPHDLQVTGGGVARALEDGGAEFALVGDPRDVAANLHLRGQGIRELGWQSLQQYPHTLAQLDVGIVPLDLTPFNEAKSWLKGLEMAALGVPFVASPTSPYRALAALGIGEMAKKPSDWHRKTLRLIKDSQYREDRRNEYRQRAALMTIEANCFQWVQAWEAALANFRKRA